MNQQLKLRLLRLLIIVFLTSLTIFLVIHREEIKNYNALGYPGIFLVSMLSNATIIFPIPGVLFTTAMGAVFHPFWVAIIAGFGAAFGELTGYLAGYSGQEIIHNFEWYNKIHAWILKYGTFAIFLLAVIPNPIFDIAGMAAGVMRIPIWRFFLWCLLAKIIKMLFFAYGGAALITILI